MNTYSRFGVSLVLSAVIFVGLVSIAPTVAAQNDSDTAERVRLQSLIKDLQSRLDDLKRSWQKASSDVRQEIKDVRQAEKDLRKEEKKNDDKKSDDSSSDLLKSSGSIVLSELPGNLRVSCQLPELRLGSRNNSVFLLQMTLMRLGHYSEGLITGYFGKLTQEAVARFESQKGLPITRLVSKETRAQLNSAIHSLYGECKELPQPNDSRFDGMLSPISYATTQMWGSYMLKLDNGTTYPVKTITNNAASDAKSYAGSRVRVFGRLVYNDFEGGFWGIEAQDVDLLKSEVLRITRPEASEEWRVGKSYLIAWKGLDYASGETVTIIIQPPLPECVNANPACMIAVPAPYTITTKAPNSGSFLWQIPQDLPNMYRGKQQIRVTYNNGGTSATSEPFFVLPYETQEISVSSPVHNDVWIAGSQQVIRYTAPASVSRVNIMLDSPVQCLTVPCPSSVLIASSVSNSGSYAWIVPTSTLSASTYRIRVSAVSGSYADGVSGFFTIKNLISNTAPVIHSVTGPEVLRVSESGTWIIHAQDFQDDSLAYSVSWGDEPSTILRSTSLIAPYERGQRATFSHTYVTPGTYTIIFNVSDPQGLSASRTAKVTIGTSTINSAPKIVGFPAIPTVIRVGDASSFSWTAQDADSDKLSWEVSWDESLGQTQDTSSCSVPACATYTAGHVWQTSGNHRVSVIVRDGRGGSDTHSFNVVVQARLVDQPPVITYMYSPSRLVPGQLGNWTFKAYDDIDSSLKYEIVFGDETLSGQTLAANTFSQAMNQEVKFTHAYQNAGRYTVTLIVTDSSGLSSRASATVDVRSY